ncbi:hypothetical protein M0804_015026 [Polistes exclamans]|nr:hypothetical protein M0804_015026 [Polistes exclamans]
MTEPKQPKAATKSIRRTCICALRANTYVTSILWKVLLEVFQDKVMPKESCWGLLLTLVPLFVGVCDLAGAISGSQYPVCKPGLEFWSTERASCWPCTRCAPEFTLSPCAVHKDAICGPLSALELDWSFLSTRKRPENGQRRLEAVTSKMLWRFPDLDQQQQQQQSQEQRQQEKLKQETRSLVDATYDDEINVGHVDELSSSQEQKRSYDPRERRKSNIHEGNVLWDWQTTALVLAVCACVVFFLVAGCSALVYARQWRRMKKSFEPVGLEEISARLNVMVKAELAELVAGAPMSPGDPETRCQYLEKLLGKRLNKLYELNSICLILKSYTSVKFYLQKISNTEYNK